MKYIAGYIYQKPDGTAANGEIYLHNGHYTFITNDEEEVEMTPDEVIDFVVNRPKYEYKLEDDDGTTCWYYN